MVLQSTACPAASLLTDAASREVAMGPVRGYLFVAEATGDMSGKIEAGGNRMLLGVVCRTMCERLSGRHKDTSLFDPATRLPVAVPGILDPADRARLDAGIALAAGR